VQRRQDSLLEVSGACKIAAKPLISFMTLFPSFQVVDSGCCTVAAQSPGLKRQPEHQFSVKCDRAEILKYS
jgi:hypothetical protein